MKKRVWLAYFDNNKDKFLWFFPSKYWFELEEERDKENVTGMMSIMNHVWFILPDHRFNIIENPPGWSEFLYLLENPISIHEEN